MSEPNAPTIVANGNNPTTCGGMDGSIDFTFTNVPNGTYDIDYDGGTFSNVTVTNGTASVTGLSEGMWENFVIIVSGCTSSENPDVTLTDPPTPTLAATGNIF